MHMRTRSPSREQTIEFGLLSRLRAKPTERNGMSVCVRVSVFASGCTPVECGRESVWRGVCAHKSVRAWLRACV
eukprot:25023-Pleurochrysis_carterae.AAC.1